MGRSGDLVGGYINSLGQNLWGFILKLILASTLNNDSLGWH